MTDNIGKFGATAKGLAKNPLGIIALFIVLVYGLASLVTIFAGSFTRAERLPLVYFLIIFPVLVLLVFTWLVSRHYTKLFAPSDFKDEENYVKMQLNAAVSLAAATVKTAEPSDESDIQDIANTVQQFTAQPTKRHKSWHNKILWVDDRPNNNIYERRAFESLSMQFKLALSTDEALEILSKEKYAAIISDMGRREGPREGYVLLDAIRKQGNRTPFFIYAGSNAPEHKKEVAEHDGQGSTNNPQELFQMVTKAIISGK